MITKKTLRSLLRFFFNIMEYEIYDIYLDTCIAGSYKPIT